MIIRNKGNIWIAVPLPNIYGDTSPRPPWWIRPLMTHRLTNKQTPKNSIPASHRCADNNDRYDSYIVTTARNGRHHMSQWAYN